LAEGKISGGSRREKGTSQGSDTDLRIGREMGLRLHTDEDAIVRDYLCPPVQELAFRSGDCSELSMERRASRRLRERRPVHT